MTTSIDTLIYTGRFILTPNQDNKTYQIEVLSRDAWQQRFSHIKANEVYNLGKIIKIFNEHLIVDCSSHPGEWNQTNFNSLKLSLSNRYEKHNKRPIQYLKYLIIPWIVAKIFGWTCLTSYDRPIDYSFSFIPKLSGGTASGKD